MSGFRFNSNRKQQEEEKKSKDKFDQLYSQITAIDFENERLKITEEVQNVKSRFKAKSQKHVNPLLDTFDLLYLQEISLRSRKLNNPMQPRNKEIPNRTKETRRGGKHKKRLRKKLDDLLKYGLIKNENLIVRSEKRTHEPETPANAYSKINLLSSSRKMTPSPFKGEPI